MLMLARSSEVPRNGFGRVPRIGAFGLHKDDEWDHVVCERVPSNAMEELSKLVGGLLLHGSRNGRLVRLVWTFIPGGVNNMKSGPHGG